MVVAPVCGTSGSSVLGRSPFQSPPGHEAGTDRWRTRHRSVQPPVPAMRRKVAHQIVSYRRHRTRAVFLAWPRSVRVANCRSRPGWHRPAQGPGHAWPRPKCPGSASHPLAGRDDWREHPTGRTRYPGLRRRSVILPPHPRRLHSVVVARVTFGRDEALRVRPCLGSGCRRPGGCASRGALPGRAGRNSARHRLPSADRRETARAGPCRRRGEPCGIRASPCGSAGSERHGRRAHDSGRLGHAAVMT